MDINYMQIFSEEHLPIVSGVYNQLKISEKIDEVVSWDKEKYKLSPFKVLKSPSYVDAILLNKLERIKAFRSRNFLQKQKCIMGKGTLSFNCKYIKVIRMHDNI